MALVAAAGPASNIVLALALTPVAREFLTSSRRTRSRSAVVLIIQLNLFLAVFNLIPLPPLDGFSVLVGLVPQDTAVRLDRLRSYGPGLLIGLFLLVAIVPGASGIISRPVLWATSLLLGG